MAIYHFSAQILGRAPRVDKTSGRIRPGSSAVAAAAYRSGERLQDDRQQKVQDYSQKRGVVHSELLVPEAARAWLTDRGQLWNKVEAMEERKDAQLAREINVALPHELDRDARLALVRRFVSENFVSKGMIADVAWHEPVIEEGQNPRNHHAHIMLTLRKATTSGLHPVKTREWNSAEQLDGWRKNWAEHVNEALRNHRCRERIDHRTLKAQRADAQQRGDRAAAARLDRLPEIHVGPRARRVHARAGEERWVPRSGRPERGAPRQRQAGARPQRSVRDYTRTDRGTRVDWLTNILLANDHKSKARIVKFERQMARFSRKLDYWHRALDFKLEGAIRGREFRFKRAQVAAAERAAREKARQRREHAAKRAKMIREILDGFGLVFAAMRGGREDVLNRRREVERWRQIVQYPRVREQERTHQRKR